MTEVTSKVEHSLRRFVSSGEAKCTGPYGYHNASISLGEAPVVLTSDGYVSSPKHEEYANDPRWPTHCPCGYEFQPLDQWQVFVEQIYRSVEDGREWPMRSLPPGAMYDATWYSGSNEGPGPDGVHLCICLPPGGGMDYWYVDGSATNGPGWTRTGALPNVTASPSILTPRYHGWLRDGVLVSC